MGAEPAAGAVEERGWTALQFQEQEGVGDWRVLARGASALFRTGSLAAGAALLERVGKAGAGTDHPDVDLRREGVVVRVRGSEGRFGAADARLARAISAAAADLGAAADPAAVQEVELTIDALDGGAIMPFWAAVLGHRQGSDEDLLDPHWRWPGIWFQEMDAPRPLRNRIHLDVFVPHDRRQAVMDAAFAAGGRHVNTGFAPHWWTLADPEGNEADLVAWEAFEYPLTEPWLTPEAFRAAGGVEDWRVLQGASAYYPTRDLAEGVALVAAAARLADDAGLALFADLRPGGATLRVAPPEDDWIDRDRLALAQRIQGAARELGLTADPAVVRDVQLTFDALDIPALQRFWAAALGYAEREDTDLFDPLLRGPSIFFQQLDAPREQRNRIHVDMFVPHDQARARLDAALAAGGRIVYDAGAPIWWTVADPEGNEVDITVGVGREEAWAERQAQQQADRQEEES